MAHNCGSLHLHGFSEISTLKPRFKYERRVVLVLQSRPDATTTVPVPPDARLHELREHIHTLSVPANPRLINSGNKLTMYTYRNCIAIDKLYLRLFC